MTEMDAIRHVLEGCNDYFEKEGMNWSTLTFIMKTLQVAATTLEDEFWYKLKNATVKKACHAGCSYCCRTQVMVTVPEVAVVLWYIADKYKAQTRMIYEKIVEVDRTTCGLPYDKRFKTGMWCPLLVDNLCTVYPVRPFACRSLHSLDSDLCRFGYGELNVIGIPCYLDMETNAVTLESGLIASLIQRGVTYGAQSVELVAALRIAMESQNCIDRWLEGENVFVEAEVLQGDEHTKIVEYHRKMALGEYVQDESMEEALPRQIREKILLLENEMQKSRHLLK